MIDPTEEYDPEGGHSKEEADAAYAQLYKELHGEEPGSDNDDETFRLHPKMKEDEEALLVSITEEGPQLLKVKVLDTVDITDGADIPLFHRAAARATTCALIWHSMTEYGLDISEKLSRDLLTGIIKQCCGFNSPDTTSLDREAAVSLAHATGIDIAEFALTIPD